LVFTRNGWTKYIKDDKVNGNPKAPFFSSDKVEGKRRAVSRWYNFVIRREVESMQWKGVIQYYREHLNLPEHSPVITLLEGNTPLIPLPKLAKSLGTNVELYAKFEGLNPTGSFKDRGMTVAISEAAGRKAGSVICASTGNTAASAAAYASRAGMRCIVLIPQGKVAMGKLAGAIAYGAQVIQIDGSFDDALTLVLDISRRHPIALVNSLNPFRLEGQKTAAFEICDVLGKAPDWLCLPVGNAGNISAYWMGFKQYHGKKGTGLPKILGVQAEGSAPLVIGHPVDKPETVATAIRIGRPARGEQALEAAQESGGRIIAVSDADILRMQNMLASEGLWVEPASAAGISGLVKLIGRNEMRVDGMRIVTICTGHGLKDPDIITIQIPPIKTLPPDLAILEKEIMS
jgi:threonine synthase